MQSTTQHPSGTITNDLPAWMGDVGSLEHAAYDQRFQWSGASREPAGHEPDPHVVVGSGIDWCEQANLIASDIEWRRPNQQLVEQVQQWRAVPVAAAEPHGVQAQAVPQLREVFVQPIGRRDGIAGLIAGLLLIGAPIAAAVTLTSWRSAPPARTAAAQTATPVVSAQTQQAVPATDNATATTTTPSTDQSSTSTAHFTVPAASKPAATKPTTDRRAATTTHPQVSATPMVPQVTAAPRRQVTAGGGSPAVKLPRKPAATGAGNSHENMPGMTHGSGSGTGSTTPTRPANAGADTPATPQQPAAPAANAGDAAGGGGTATPQVQATDGQPAATTHTS